MAKNFKKGISAALAAAMCTAAVSASAASWVPVNIDVANGGVIQYQEYDDQGLPTGRSASGTAAEEFGLPGYAKLSVEDSWVSDVYPNVEYQNVYAETESLGKLYTGSTVATGRNGLTLTAEGKTLVEYRDVDFMWEVAAPYKIYSITQAKLSINGAMQWYGEVDHDYPVNYTGRNADVTVERTAYGFGDYKVTGTNTVEIAPVELRSSYTDPRAKSAITGVSAALLAPVVASEDGTTVTLDTPPTVTTNRTTANGGSYVVDDSTYWHGATDMTTNVQAGIETVEVVYDAAVSPESVHYNVTDVADEIRIPRTYDLKLTGPDFDDDGNAIANGLVVEAAAADPEDYANFGISNILSVCSDTLSEAITYCDITWTAGGYEYEPNHSVYEFLTVDGVVMDGTQIFPTVVLTDGTVLPAVYKPYLFRYTGATANVTHRTRTIYDSVQNGEVMAMLQVSYDDGATWVDLGTVGTGIYPNTVSVATVDMDPLGLDSTIDPSVKYGTYVYVFYYDGEKHVEAAPAPTDTVDGWINTEVHIEVPGTTELDSYVHIDSTQIATDALLLQTAKLLKDDADAMQEKADALATLAWSAQVFADEAMARAEEAKKLASGAAADLLAEKAEEAQVAADAAQVRATEAQAVADAALAAAEEAAAKASDAAAYAAANGQ